jgi:branched-chain amino acid transport system substrate-binding protein
MCLQNGRKEENMSQRARNAIVLVSVVLFVVSLTSWSWAAEPPTKTLKIGLVMFLGWDLGVNTARGIEVMAEQTNKKGGLAVGNEKYKIEIIKYDSKFVPETARAAAERLVYQDKVKFIIGDETVDAWVPVTEQNKVLVVGILFSPTQLNPRNKYLFNGTGLQTQMPTTWGWFAKNYPQIKNSVQVFPDNKIGQIRSGLAKKCAAVFGPALPDDYLIFYPPEATDMSVIGTKVKTLKPDGFCATAGGVQGDALALKAAWQAGYKGQMWSFVEVSENLEKRIVPVECIEGLVAAQYSFEREPIPPVTKEFMDGWSAKYGTYEQQAGFYDLFTVLAEGIRQAKSLDTDKVAEVLAHGMQFEGVSGTGKMISRPDVNNPRTVDLIFGQVMKQTVKGKAKVLAIVTPDDAYSFNKQFWGWK